MVTDEGLELVSVYDLRDVAATVLYRLLEERDETVNISHRTMPSWDEHLKFIEKRPYDAWYVLRSEGENVGAIYLTALGEIGVGILSSWRERGFAPRAVRALMRRHPRIRFLANVNPRNEASIRMFADMGFHLLQYTYELRTENNV